MTDPLLPIALDAMGGDSAPRDPVRGAARAARSLGVRVQLVGRADALEAELRELPADAQPLREQLEIVEAGQVIGMDEHPGQAVRSKPDSSVLVACRQVDEGRARAAVSAGNSGATLAAALFSVRRSPRVARPAIGTLLPTATGDCFVLDVGANTDCKPEWLAQFAVMGSIHQRLLHGVADPRVALLSNGEEPGKGSQLVQAATPLLDEAAARFVGNVEGKDLFGGACDVAVCDGFVGNVALKMAEGVAEFLFAQIAQQARSSLQGKLAGALLKPKLRPIRDRVDYRHTGGALLLGVGGEVVIAHGRSDAVAIESALRVADRAATREVHAAIARELAGAPEPAPTAAEVTT